MKPIYFVLILFFISIFAQAQVIRRWESSKSAIKSKHMPCEVHPNVFTDFGWSFPDVKSRPVNLSADGYEFVYRGVNFKLAKANINDISVARDGHVITTEHIQKSNNTIYFDKKMLRLKAITRYKWVSHTYYQSTMVPVTQYRNVTTYQYDYASHSSHPVSSMQSYTTYQSHMTPVTSNTWQPYTDYVPDVPVFDYYDLNLDKENHLLLYTYQGKYYLQNPQYLQATDEDKVNYILVDNDVNGKYTDPDDAMMFNSWNPYNKASKYKPIAYTRENYWKPTSYYEGEEFVYPSVSNSQLTIDSKNDEYEGVKDKGRVYFENIPSGAVSTINGKSYHLGSGEKDLKCEYGVFNLKIARTGFLDYDTIFTVNDQNKEVHIVYNEPIQGAELKITNIFSKNYYINVANASGFSKTYHNTNIVSIPEGNDSVEVFTNGNSVTLHVQAKVGEKVDLDFEAELKKITTQSKDVPEQTEQPKEGKTEETK